MNCADNVLYFTGVVDVCLIPEVDFLLDGYYGVLQYMEHKLAIKGHLVICVAEGAGQVTGRLRGCWCIYLGRCSAFAQVRL